jgi:endo-1,4-beta-xylanase Y
MHDRSASYKTGNVTIKGNAKVTINMTHNGTSTYERAYGIYAKENITISGDASVDITCATPSNTRGGDRCNGLYEDKNVTIATNGTIKIDVTKACKDDGYSYGVYPMGTATLTKVGNMEVNWKKDAHNSNYSGGTFFGGGSFNASTHAVNEDTTNCYASYRKGTPYQVTAGNGKLTGHGVKYPNGSGMFLKGDTVNITPNVKTGKSGEVIPFQKWTSDDVTFDKSAATASNSFTVPAKKVTVTAMHSPFIGTLTFTPTGDLNDRGVLTLETLVRDYDGSEYFNLVKVGDEGTYISFNPNTTSTSPPYVYTYKASSGFGASYVAPGEYYVAEKLDNWWYLSEKFTVNYVKPRPEISVSYWSGTTVFPSEEEGYAFAQGRILTIDNKGAADTGPLTITVEGANPDAFTVSPSSIKSIAAGKSAMSTVRPAKGLTAGTYTATLKISGANVNTLRRNVEFTVTNPNASAAVSGTITSYGSASEAVTVTLLQGTNTVSTATLTGASGSVPYSQNYSFPAVAAGEYTLKVEKTGHAPFSKVISVDGNHVTENVTIYLIGDVNGDGAITADDLTALARHVAKISIITDTAALARCDVTKDGSVTADDLTMLARYVAKIISSFD